MNGQYKFIVIKCILIGLKEKKQDIEIPFDRMADFNRFNKITIEYSHDDYKPIMNFSPNYLDFSINTFTLFRGFLFHGTTCRFIH